MRRDPNLDLLRAAAVTAVVAAHLPVLSPVHRPWFSALAWAGQFGVDLFFVLSGWLVSGLYFRDRQRGLSWVSFVGRRVLRTVPPYYAALLAAWAAARWFRPDHPAFAFSYLFFLQNYFGRLPYFSVSWSLCIEEHFYLVLPALLARFRPAATGTGVALVAAMAVSPLVRLCLYRSPSIDVFDSSVFSTHAHLDGLVMGVAARWLQCFRPTWWQPIRTGCRAAAWPALALLGSVYFIPPRFFYEWGYTYVSAWFIVILAAVAEAPALAGATWPLTRTVARMSYSTYLTHALALHGAGALATALMPTGLREIAYYGLAVTGTLGLSALFYWSIERPSLNLRSRLFPTDLDPRANDIPVAAAYER